MLEWRGCPGPAPRRAVCLLGLRTAAGGLWGAAWPPTCVRWAGGPPAARTRFLSPTSSPHAAPGTKHTSQGTLPGLGTLRKPPASHTRGATAPSTCPTEASCRAFVPANTGHASHLHSVACPEVPDCATCSLHWKHAARTAEGPAAGCLPAGRTASPAQAKRTERGPSAAAPSLRWPHATWALSVLDQEGVRRPQLCVGCKGCPSVAHRVGGMQDTVSPGGPPSMLEMWTQDDGMTRPVPGNFPR